MKLVQLLFLAAGSFFLISEARVQPSSNSVVEWKRDTQQADKGFKCPSSFGSFPDPEDCSHFYVCMFGRGVRGRCPPFQSFDSRFRKCVHFLVAVCDNKDKSTTSTVTVTTPVSTTTDEDSFVCSSFMGSFPHPNDCSKYYSCFMYKHTLKTCPKKELFDAVKKACKPEAGVHCGSRKKPQDLTTTEKLDETTTVEEQTPTETDETETDFETDTPLTTLETTENIITTTEVRPTGPPEHDCDEDDVDCIITETGDANDWFKCPDDVGSYAHPSSDKLFIFCMNWIPSVKKCGLDLVFSKELSTCVASLS